MEEGMMEAMGEMEVEEMEAGDVQVDVVVAAAAADNPENIAS